MAVGEKLQYYRKREKLSQEELGQKLLVSRQTISLWETGQTLPTIDNLIKLKDIFNVSIDELLGEENIQEQDAPPEESYTFRYSLKELKQIQKNSIWNVFKFPLIFIVLLILYLFPLSDTAEAEANIAFAMGIIITIIILNIRNFVAHKKSWKQSNDRIVATDYIYDVYSDHISIQVRRNQEVLRSSKHYFSEIEKVQDIGKFLLFQLNSQLFIIRKSELSPNSQFFEILTSKTKNKKLNSATGKWKTLSVSMVAASIISIFAAVICVLYVDTSNVFTTDNMWIFFLFLPIPITSIIVGIFLKSKGFKATKNIVTGIITAVILCIYGSFTFIFADLYDDSPVYIQTIESYTGIDIPAPEEIVTQDWTIGTSLSSRDYIYYMSNVFFKADAVEDFEEQLSNDERWISTIPNGLICVLPTIYNYQTSDYVLLYNTDTEEFNTAPSQNGTYRFVYISYDSEHHEMQIIEYDMYYVN